MSCYEFIIVIVQALVAIGTIAVAITAIWGDFIRNKYYGPKLNITLLDSLGDLTYLLNGIPGLYYKFKVENNRLWSPAKNVRVLLLRVYKPAADGKYVKSDFSGPIQITWQWSDLQYQNIGPESICTFGHLIKGKNFELSTYVKPNNLDRFIKANEKMIIVVKAVADTAESNTLNVEISWNGKWNDDRVEMSKNLVIKETNQELGC